MLCICLGLVISSINAKKMERVQKFTLQLCTKMQSANYHLLLIELQILLFSTRVQAKIMLIQKCINKLSYLPPGIFLLASALPRLFPPSKMISSPCNTTTSIHSFASTASKIQTSYPLMSKRLRIFHYLKALYL